jgi:DNA-binding PadR family transcriptional regulator
MDVMVLEIFALSILRARPVHGYELKRRVQRPSLASLSNNSLYPMLRRFENEGLVTRTTQAQEGKPARNVYAITDAGRERLRSLLWTLPPDLATNEEEFLVRVSFFHEIPEANQRAIITAREAVLAASRAKISSLLAELDESPKSEWRGHVVMQHVLDTIDAERTWIAGLASRSELTNTPHPNPTIEPAKAILQ